jgi:hypothetical protein
MCVFRTHQEEDGMPTDEIIIRLFFGRISHEATSADGFLML